MWDAPKAWLASGWREKLSRPILVVTREKRLYDNFPFFTSAPVLEFPALETLPGELVSPDLIGQRLTTLRTVMVEEAPIVLVDPQAVLQEVASPKWLEENCRTFRVGEELSFSTFAEMGYVRRPLVVEKGEYAIRGGIVDIFPVDLPDPYRIEFWGDEIESIRTFDPVGQRSLDKVEALTLVPAREEMSTSLFDYFENPLLIVDECPTLPPFPVDTVYWGDGEGKKIAHPFRRVSEELLNDLEQVVDMGLSLTFVCETHSEEETLRKQIGHLILPKDTKFVRGYLSSGYLDERDAVIPMTEFTHRYKVRRQKMRSTTHGAPIDFTDLKPGEFVVHYHSGIARYLGIEKRPDVEGIETEYLALEFAERGRLFVPITRADLISRYIGSSEEEPKLSALGSGRWERTRNKTQKAIRDYAHELLKLHAERELAEGFAYPGDSDALLEFESDFPYEETPDQLRAIGEIKRDMVAAQPMDRLICGDVGYGKTEVAMRAAFKAVVDGNKQVAVLVPTTVLAMQHYETFCDRMANFPVRVGVLSRFRTPKEQKLTLAGLASGAVDILVGTHRLISRDVIFKDLGLVIIDEEQKFGVKVKEKLRSFKKGVDCLTMTATPIPRTLYLSIMGARDLSVINTPPQDRVPIKTTIGETDPQLIKQALHRELRRAGQAFVIHNRVETIDGIASQIQELLPEARILVGHGQMSADALDEIFHRFKLGEADILVATTIVENGVDIPNANTIIVDRADRYGLADLYQLRGRVGRWNRTAFAYFLTPKNREIAEISQKRLSALLEISGYGGGMRLAMRDLEIRGAGNILGTEQSGHVSAVGFHLYCKMLTRTIAALKGELPNLVETKIEFPFDARLPENYVNEPTLRMELYQRFGEAVTESQLDALFEEVQDRFGRPPEPVLWLYHLQRIRLFASAQGVRTLKLHHQRCEIDGHPILIGGYRNPKEYEKRVIYGFGVRQGHGARP